MAFGLAIGCGGEELRAQVVEAPEDGDAAGHRRMLEELARIAARAPEVHPWLETRTARTLRERFAALPANAPALQRWRVNHRLGVAELQLGNETEALRHLETAYELLPQVRGRVQPDAIEQSIMDLGVAYMRFGETRNCCLRYNGESCIMPLRGGGLHSDPEGSSKAAARFLEVIARPDASTTNALTAKWLLNLAHMTLGTWPDSVPEGLRLPRSVAHSDADFPRFANVLPGLNLDTFNLAGGVVVDDMDGDGLLDIVTSTWDTGDGMKFFRNRGDGGFDDLTESAGLTHFYGGLNLIQGDYDNDGDLDLFVLRGAWMGTEGQHPNSLLRNNGDLTFTDVTYAAGLAEPAYPTKVGVWGDYDNDGDLDLFVGNETSGHDEVLGVFLGGVKTGALEAPCQLFRNNGDGTFTDVAPQAGVAARRYVMGASWGDYDEDGDLDLYLSVMGPNLLFRNKGDGTFEEVAEALGVTHTLASFSTWFWDFDNDGHLDLYTSASSGPVSVLALFPEGLDVDDPNPAVKRMQDWARTMVQLPSLYKGDGAGGFREVAREQKLTDLTLPMGANFGDLDNDGFLDFYLSTGSFLYSDLQPNLMFHNQRGKGFENVTMAGGFGHLQKGHGVAFADIDHDGDLDVYAQMGGAVAGDKFNDALFENPGFGNRWLAVELRGTRTNRFGVGARLRAEIVEDDVVRSVFRHVNSGGSFGSSPLRQTLGLGRAEGGTCTLEVFWPTTGELQRFEQVALDRCVRITEGRSELVQVPLQRFELGEMDR
ncbi:MAG TPA: VCBS repeat-containing protein [Planctomycetota bacterium]|nr:VCBS repeat-containing protein [Planctomycetota bacterium]